VQGLDLKVRSGEWLNLVVHEASRELRDTLALVLAGLRRPGGGILYWNGRDAWRNIFVFRDSLRFITASPELFLSLTAAENLNFFTALFSLRGSVRSDYLKNIDPDELVTFLSANRLFMLKMATVLTAPRPLVVCSYPLERLNFRQYNLVCKDLQNFVQDSRIVITIDTVPHEQASDNLLIKTDTSSSEEIPVGEEDV